MMATRRPFRLAGVLAALAAFIGVAGIAYAAGDSGAVTVTLNNEQYVDVNWVPDPDVPGSSPDILLTPEAIEGEWVHTGVGFIKLHANTKCVIYTDQYSADPAEYFPHYVTEPFYLYWGGVETADDTRRIPATVTLNSSQAGKPNSGVYRLTPWKLQFDFPKAVPPGASVSSTVVAVREANSTYSRLAGEYSGVLTVYAMTVP